MPESHTHPQPPAHALHRANFSSQIQVGNKETHLGHLAEAAASKARVREELSQRIEAVFAQADALDERGTRSGSTPMALFELM